MCVPGTAPSPSPTADLTLSWESSSKDFYCTSTHSVSHSGPERLTVMVQPSNSSDSMSGGAQLELNFHWQSSMEMKSRDGDGETSFTLEPRAWLSLTSSSPVIPKCLNILECTFGDHGVYQVCYWMSPLVCSCIICKVFMFCCSSWWVPKLYWRLRAFNVDLPVYLKPAI